MSAYVRLARLLSKHEHFLWAERVKPHLPHCVTVYNNLLQHGRGLVSHEAFYVLRNRPNSATVLCKNEMIPNTQHFGIFCLEEEVDTVMEVLKSSALIDWEDAKRNDFVIHHVPPYAVEPLLRLVEERGLRMLPKTYRVFTYDANLDTHTLRVPAGFRVCMLGRAGVRHLLEKANYSGILDLMYRMADDLPYIGVYQDPTSTQEATVDPLNLPVAGDEKIPVAWCCSNPSGEGGKMVIDERFRRRGFGNLLGTTLARRQAALLGFIPHGFIKVDNSASTGMANTSPGFSMTHESIRITKCLTE